MSPNDGFRPAIRWALFRLQLLGRLLACPPLQGQLQTELAQLASQPWSHPITGEPVRFGVSTIERWFYLARNAGDDPVTALQRRVRADAGQFKSVTVPLRLAVRVQYQAHPSWSYQLHHDNLAVLAEQQAELGHLPSYATLVRYFRAQGYTKQPRRRRPDTAAARAAQQRLEQREVRSYEADYVHGLWHSDFHHGSRQVLTSEGHWITPILLCVLDDHSRVACHAQWYLDETAETFVHGLSQALQKRGLPRALMTDNGSAMRAAETRHGLAVLGIQHDLTLAYSPYQNAKQEVFWAQVEGRLLAMLEGEPNLTLPLLNEATQAWIEYEYNRSVHDELGVAPLQRLLHGKSVVRDCPGSQKLREAFRAEVVRTQRRSDGTVTLLGRRFELPSRYRHLERVNLRYASWDFSHVDLVETRTGTVLSGLWPLCKSANAQGHRRAKEPLAVETAALPPSDSKPAGIAPLLAKLMKQYAATGLPPAYLPKLPAPEPIAVIDATTDPAPAVQEDSE